MSDPFQALRAILARHAADLIVTTDNADHYALGQADGGKTVFVAAVQRKKAYVAYHLYPVYAHPALLDGLSDDLKRRMQGKSCFNFKRTDPALFKELAALTARAFHEEP